MKGAEGKTERLSREILHGNREISIEARTSDFGSGEHLPAIGSVLIQLLKIRTTMIGKVLRELGNGSHYLFDESLRFLGKTSFPRVALK